ncbi:hypothetical protein C3733_00400 [Bacillus amyloliquefaciens]|nr:hypothetical protein C3733_00400 [Bacillus amyloliquefaciens]
MQNLRNEHIISNVLFQGAFFMPFLSSSHKRTERGSQHVQLEMDIFRKRQTYELRTFVIETDWCCKIEASQLRLIVKTQTKNNMRTS